MAQLIDNVDIGGGGHWYTRDAEPFHEIENASKPGTLRPVNLRDARKLGLLPSVTSVLSLLAKKGLDQWKIEQAILSAITLPRLDSETDDMFARRVAEDCGAESRKATDFGKRLHAGVENYFATDGKIVSVGDEEIDPFVGSFATWFEMHERDLCNCVIDFKTQGKEPWDKFTFYHEWCWQLAAYREAICEQYPDRIGLGLEQCVVSLRHGFGGRVDLWDRDPGVKKIGLVSIAISSKSPGHIEMKRWTEKEAREGWQIFKATLNLWKKVKGYDPTKGPVKCSTKRQKKNARPASVSAE